MKRFDPKNKYLGWGITAFGVIACCILFYMLLQHGKSIGDAISSLLGILSPIIWGLVIAYLLWPLTKVFQRKLFEPLLKKLRPKKPVRTSLARGLSVALSILVALIIIAALIWLIIPQIYTSVESIVLNYQEYYDTITGWINKFFENNPEVEEVLLSATGDVSDSLLDTAFMGFISGKVIDSAIIGVICYICCAIMRMPYVVLVSVIVAVTNIIPVFGPFIGAVPTALIILLVSPMKCLIYVIFIIVLQQIDGNIIGPKILGNSTGINGFWIMFAILLGGGLFGFIGMLLGVPVFVVIYAGLERLVDHGLKKRGLQTETAEYMDLDYIDDATMQPVRLPQEVPDESLKDPKDDSVK